MAVPPMTSLPTHLAFATAPSLAGANPNPIPSGIGMGYGSGGVVACDSVRAA